MIFVNQFMDLMTIRPQLDKECYGYCNEKEDCTVPEGHQNDLTLCRKQAVAETYRQEQCEVKQRRQEAMIQAKQRELLEKKAANEREALANVHIIITVAGKNNKKLAVL